MKLNAIRSSLLFAMTSPVVVAIPAIASASSQEPGVLLSRLQYEDAQTIDPGPTGVVDVSKPLSLVVTVGFQSDLQDPITGIFSVSELDYRWRFWSDVGIIEFPPAPGFWIGGVGSKPRPTIIAFDRATGNGTATVTIPIGLQAPGSEVRYPLLPEIADRVEFCLVWRGSFDVDENGLPQSPLVLADLPVSTWCPDVWVDPGSRAIPIGALHYIAVLSRENLEQARTYIIHNPWPNLVRFDADLGWTGDVEVEVAAGEWSAMVPVRAIHSGMFAFELRRSTGERLGSTGIIEACSDFAATMDRLTTSPQGTVLPGAIVDIDVPMDILDDPQGWFNPTPNNKKCIPAKGYSGTYFVKCSECVEEGDEATVECPEYRRPWKTATCPWHWWNACYTIPNDVTTAAYRRIGVDVSSCSTGGWRVSASVVFGRFGAGVSREKPTGIRLCCKYERLPGSETTESKRGCFAQ